MSEENEEMQKSSATEENKSENVTAAPAPADAPKETTGRQRIRRHIPYSERVSPYSERHYSSNGGNDYQQRERNYPPRDRNYQGGDRNYQRSDNAGYRSYPSRDGGYQSDNYRQRDRYDAQGSYQRQRDYRQGGYQSNDRGYSKDRYNQDTPQYSPREAYSQRLKDNRQPAEGNGDYQNRNYNRYDNGGYNSRPQGGYQREQGGYQREQGGYQREQGGYQREQGYNNQDGGYNRIDNGYRGGYSSYNNRGQGNGRPSYNRYDPNRRSTGGYSPRQGGYQQRPPRPYQKRDNYDPSAKYSEKKILRYKEENVDPTLPLRLNKFLSNAGVCSRREADKYIADGLITVNGEVVKELGSKVMRTDEVKFRDKAVELEDKIYIILNKPKDCVTTSDDPKERRTVMDLVKGACPERIYPIGRLDRNTTGVLLLTNDGNLASKLMHPKFLKKKIYHVYLDKTVTEEDMKQILEGVELEDGEIKADAVEYASEIDKKQVGIEIHSGKNRIVRRIFEYLGYRVTRLDRVYFAGLTKKNLRRGDWRFLTDEEVRILRMGAFE